MRYPCKHPRKQPRKHPCKHSLKHPCTTPTQTQYGFFAASVPELRDDPMFRHLSSHSDVTLFASSYVQLKGRSLFARDGGGAGAAAAAGRK